MNKIDPTQQMAFTLSYVPDEKGTEQQTLQTLKENVFQSLKRSGVLQLFNENSAPGVRQYRVLYNPPALSSYIQPGSPVLLMLVKPAEGHTPEDPKEEPLPVRGVVHQMTLIRANPLPQLVYHVQVDDAMGLTPEILAYIRQRTGIQPGAPQDGSRRLFLLQVAPEYIMPLEQTTQETPNHDKQ